MNRRYKNVN